MGSNRYRTASTAGALKTTSNSNIAHPLYNFPRTARNRPLGQSAAQALSTRRRVNEKYVDSRHRSIGKTYPISIPLCRRGMGSAAGDMGMDTEVFDAPVDGAVGATLDR
jgi:hypothetical protein